MALLVSWIWFASNEKNVEVAPVVLFYPYQGMTILNASGYVVAQRKASLSSKASGILEWLGVQEGSVVKKGELIAQLERKDLAAQLAQEKARIGLAEAELENALLANGRSTSLLKKGYISLSSHDDTLARLNKAKAGLKAAKASKNVMLANYSQAEIRAPFDGVVLTKNANVGDNITPFSSAANSKGAVVTIADMSTLEVEVDVSESSMSKIKLGQSVVIALDALIGEKFYGKVVRMVPTIDRAKATRMIKVGFDKLDNRILPDMSSKVAFLERELNEVEKKSFFAITKEAVFRDGKSSYFFTVKQGVIKKNEIKNTILSNDDVLPVQGVELGDLVVIKPSNNLKSGEKVRILEP
jgi:RND family efflux transporter MFP subunit